MTAIAAARDPKTGSWWMAGDTLATDGWGRPYEAGAKWTEIMPGFVIAGSGSVRVCQLVETLLPKMFQGKDSFAIPTDLGGIVGLADHVRGALGELRATSREKSDDEVGKETMDALFLIIVNGKCYELGDDFGVLEMKSTAAIGCGGDLCLAALDALDGVLPPSKAVARAVQIAIRRNVFVGGDIPVIEIPPMVTRPRNARTKGK